MQWHEYTRILSSKHPLSNISRALNEFESIMENKGSLRFVPQETSYLKQGQKQYFTLIRIFHNIYQSSNTFIYLAVPCSLLSFVRLSIFNYE